MVDAADSRVRRRAAAYAREQRETRQRLLAAAGVDCVSLSTARDYAIPLRQAFAQRARRLHRG